MVSLLDERELTDEERAAVADEPRPGVNHRSGIAYSQDDTDELIYWELCEHASEESLVILKEAWSPQFQTFTNGEYYWQRGGIHSDPLVRLLAFRAWGDRDREWGQGKRCSVCGAWMTLASDIERGRHPEHQYIDEIAHAATDN